jgi:hypothetical protein
MVIVSKMWIVAASCSNSVMMCPGRIRDNGQTWDLCMIDTSLHAKFEGRRLVQVCLISCRYAGLGAHCEVELPTLVLCLESKCPAYRHVEVALEERLTRWRKHFIGCKSPFNLISKHDDDICRVKRERALH